MTTSQRKRSVDKAFQIALILLLVAKTHGRRW